MNKIFKFYKYQPLSEENHFYYLKNYLDQRVWMVPFEQLNDPYEGGCSSIPYSSEVVLSNPHLFNSLLRMNHLNGRPELTADELRMHLNSKKDFQYSLKNNAQIEKFSRYGVLCLTIKNNDIPMWAYYAGNHKGYCVEFELDFSGLYKTGKMSPDKMDDYINNIIYGSEILIAKSGISSQEFIFSKVQYSKRIPTLVADDFVKLNNRYDQVKYFVRNSIGVKSTSWEHEDEFRLIVNANSEESGLLPLQGFAPFLKVTGIIIGNQMEGNKRKRVHDLCQNNNIRSYSAIYSSSTYEAIIEPH